MIKILIADDHPIVRQGFKQVLSDTPDLVVADEAGNGQEVLSLVSKKDYDVILLDISMPGKSGLEVLKELKVVSPKTPVLILSIYPEEQYAIRALKAGASGYLTKASAPEELISAIRKVSRGGSTSVRLWRRRSPTSSTAIRRRPRMKRSPTGNTRSCS